MISEFPRTNPHCESRRGLHLRQVAFGRKAGPIAARSISGFNSASKLLRFGSVLIQGEFSGPNYGK